MSSPAAADLPTNSSVTSPYFSQDKEDNQLSAASSVPQCNRSQFFQRNKLDIYSSSSSILDTYSSSSSILETSSSTCSQSSKLDLGNESNVSSARSFAECILDCEYELSVKLKAHCSSDDFCSDVKYIYSPLEYAYYVHSDFLKKYCQGPKTILFLGMNPGPWGMMQTGVPFGEITIVRNWLKVNGTINVPEKQHPLRPITGFNCKRSEVSGKRFWDLAKILSEGDPNSFFRNCFIYNYFPLSLLTATGKNLTPADLPNHVQASVHGMCDEALCDIVIRLKSKIIVAIGRFAEKRAIAAFKRKPKFASIKVVFISHPSPRNPRSNKNWVENTKCQLESLHLLDWFS